MANERQEEVYRKFKAMYDGNLPLDQEFCKKALCDFPDDHRLRVLQGHLRSSQGCYDESLAYLKDARSIVLRKHNANPTPVSEEELAHCEADIAVVERCRGSMPLGKPQIPSIPSL